MMCDKLKVVADFSVSENSFYGRAENRNTTGFLLQFNWLQRNLNRPSGAKVYFAKPYASYQRGNNQNTHGLIRRYWPKGIDFEMLNDTEVKNMELHLNRMPRVVIGGLTPLEDYMRKSVALIA